eukprot:8267160-Pyramimonas_sp.AAC.1
MGAGRGLEKEIRIAWATLHEALVAEHINDAVLAGPQPDLQQILVRNQNSTAQAMAVAMRKYVTSVRANDFSEVSKIHVHWSVIA